MLAVALLGVVLAGAAAAYGVAYRRENRPDRILGLLYHRLVADAAYVHCTPTEKIFAIAESRFREQMETLKREGYHAVSLEAVLDYIESGTPLPPRPVLISFDDGSVSVHERALPILRGLGMPALLFVTTDPEAWIFALGDDPQRRITPTELKELVEGGFSIGSHSVSHPALADLDEAEIRRELGESKRWLEETLGQEVRYFGVPLNFYGPKVRAVAQELGYRAVCTSDNGTIHGDSDPFHLRRFVIEGGFSLEQFRRSLGAGSIVQRRIVSSVKRLPRRLLGPRLWLPLRRRLFDSFLGRYFDVHSMKRIVAAGAALGLALAAAAVWAFARA